MPENKLDYYEHLTVAFILGMLLTGITVLYFTDLKYQNTVKECNDTINELVKAM